MIASFTSAPRSSEKSSLVSSTIIAPASTPTYQLWSRATAGVASAVEASAAIMASFRIDIPFHVHSKTELPEHLMRGPVAVQDYKSPACCRKAAQISLFSAKGAGVGLRGNQAMDPEHCQDRPDRRPALAVDHRPAGRVGDCRLTRPHHR